MLKNRQDGLTTLHAIWVTVVVTISFILYTKACQTFGWFDLIETVNYDVYYLAAFIGVIATTRVYRNWTAKLPRLTWSETLRLTKQQFIRLALVLMVLLFFVDDPVSRGFVASALIGLFGLIYGCNRWLPRMLCSVVFKSAKVPTLFVGNRHAFERLSRWVEEKSNLGFEAVGIVSDGDGSDDGWMSVPRLGKLTELDSILAGQPIAQVVLIQNDLSNDQVREVIEIAQRNGCRIHIYSNLEEQFAHPVLVDHEGEYTFFTLVDEPLENPINRLVKRVFDVAFALPIVAFLLPPLTALVWFFQRRQAPGSIFYSQPRSGTMKRTFNIIKFRTMYERKADDVAQQATKGDARIYPFGSFLRKTSLDEIPQFVNVLLGDMSVAGPRPHLLKHDSEFARHLKTYYTRHFVKPGITGLAQSKGYRGEISEVGLLEERIKYDIQYINKWSLMLDLRIIFATFRQILFPPKSAY